MITLHPEHVYLEFTEVVVLYAEPQPMQCFIRADTIKAFAACEDGTRLWLVADGCSNTPVVRESCAEIAKKLNGCLGNPE